MAVWPELDEAKQALDVTGDDWDARLGRVLAAAIHQVKIDVGDWDEASDTPDDDLAEAALVQAEILSNTTTAPESLRERYAGLIRGHRRRFHIG